jgi:hypothetical protein
MPVYEEERPATLLDAVVAFPFFLSSSKRRETDLDRLYNRLSFFLKGKNISTIKPLLVMQHELDCYAN